MFHKTDVFWKKYDLRGIVFWLKKNNSRNFSYHKTSDMGGISFYKSECVICFKIIYQLNSPNKTRQINVYNNFTESSQPNNRIG